MKSTRQARWGEYKLSELTLPHRWQVGPLHLWVREDDQEIQLAHCRSVDSSTLPDSEEDLDWTRWACEEPDPTVRISPVLPDLPVVGQPTSEMKVPRSGRAIIYLRIPIWVRLSLVYEGREVALAEVETVPLSRTWTGTMTEGELCYWIPTSARRRITEEVFEAHLAVCPVHIFNGSDEDLPVERICVRVPNLSLYLDGNKLWASESHVESRGRDRISQVTIGDQPPQEAASARLASAPRQAQSRSFLARTFGWMKDVQSWGTLS